MSVDVAVAVPAFLDITFVGLGEKFQMWEPKRFEAHLAGARQKVRDLRRLLGAGRRGSGGPEGARE